MAVDMNPFFDKIHHLPQIPEIVRTLITQFNEPSINFNAIAKNVEKEQVISLKVLRLVNSAHFGLSRKINSIQDAIIHLGMNQLRILVIASGMVNSVPKIEGFDLKRFWRNSFRTATYAKWLAAESNGEADLAFTSGLIHGLGTVLIHLGAPLAANEIEQHVKNGKARSEIEMNRLGFTSEQVCAELCRRWKFAPDLVNTIESCASPLQAEPVNKAAAAVNIARYLAYCLDQNTSATEIEGHFPFEVSNALGLSDAFIVDKLPEILTLDSGLDDLVN